MAEISLTSAMRANLASLKSTADLMGATQFKLATGNKVNSALDDPSAFFAAQGLNNRASDLTSLLDGMAQSVQAIKAADEGIKGLTSLLEQAKAIAQTAKTDLTGAALGGNTTGTMLVTADAVDLTNNAGIAAGDQFTIRAGTGPIETITILANDGLQDIADKINAIDNFSATLVHGTGADEGKTTLKISTTDASDLTMANLTNTPLAVTGWATAAAPAATADISTNIAQYDALASSGQIDSFITDTGYRGTNLLNGDTLTTQFNEDNTSSQTITGTALNVAGLGLDANASSWTSASNIDASIAKIDTALTTLRNEASRYGNGLSVIQTRQDFTSNLVGVLKDGAGQLTLADKNEEGANLLSLQTSQQLGIQALSMASQANQSVLRLFS